MRIPELPPNLQGKEFNYGSILDDLVTAGRFYEFLELTENKYYYWDKWKYIARSWGFDPLKLWYAVKIRRASYKVITPSKKENFKFRIASPSIVQEYLHEFDMHLGGFLQGDHLIPSVEKERYLISTLMEEAIASSQLEGAATTRRVAKEMLETARKPKNSSEQMILNNFNAMKWIMEHKEEPFSIKNLNHLHGTLTRSTLSKEEEGAFRSDDKVKVIDNQTGKVLHVPPSFEHLDELMEDFCAFANDKDTGAFFIHPITKAIVLHFLIGYIHPYSDGNGRTARTIFYWYLIKKGYWLIEYMSVSRIILKSKSRYAMAYLHTERDANDLTYFVMYNLRAIHIALQDLKSYVGRKNAEKQQALTMLRNTDFNDRQIAIIHEITRDPSLYFSVKQIETRFAVSNQTARNDLAGLVRRGILNDRKTGKKVHFLPAKNFMEKLGLK